MTRCDHQGENQKSSKPDVAQVVLQAERAGAAGVIILDSRPRHQWRVSSPQVVCEKKLNPTMASLSFPDHFHPEYLNTDPAGLVSRLEGVGPHEVPRGQDLCCLED